MRQHPEIDKSGRLSDAPTDSSACGSTPPSYAHSQARDGSRALWFARLCVHRAGAYSFAYRRLVMKMFSCTESRARYAEVWTVS